MKKIIGLALVAGCLAAMPVTAQAAEFPAVDIATKCEYANGHMGFKKDDRPDEITMKKLILTETEADGFTAGTKFVFTADGKMQFAEKEKTVVENGSVKAECYAEEGKLIVQILAADDTKQEALTLSDYTLDAENGALEVGSGVHYGLYADYEDADGKAEQTKVIENFVDANFEISTRTNWVITIPVGENSIYSGADRVALDTPAYLSKSGYTMLPLRAAVKAFDREPTKVDWNAGEKEVTILKGDVYLQMKAGEKKMLYGGNPLETSGELEIVNGRAFLPMRDWAKIFGAEKILWNDETKTATLKGSYTENWGR